MFEPKLYITAIAILVKKIIGIIVDSKERPKIIKIKINNKTVSMFYILFLFPFVVSKMGYCDTIVMKLLYEHLR